MFNAAYIIFQQDLCSQRVEEVQVILPKTSPETVDICVADRRTDGYNTKGQLFFNIARKDDLHRWIIVIARELAYNISRKRYPHMNAMTELLVKVIKHWYEVEEICKKTLGGFGKSLENLA